MRTLLAIIATSLAALTAGPALADSGAGHSASCGWRTDGAYFWSPTYTETTHYIGHQVFGGLYYRTFQDYHAIYYGSSVPSYYLHNSWVYCG